MNSDLFFDMYYAAPELWHFVGFILAILILAIFFLQIKFLKLKQKNYFLNRDRERYAETLYASKDGYFAFIYPDEKSLKLLDSACEALHKDLNALMKTKVTFGEIKNITRSTIGKILFEHTNRNPMIIPIIMNKNESKL